MKYLPNSIALTLGVNGGVEKTKLERATGRPWTEFECSQRTIQLREYALREFWEIFVDDRPFFNPKLLLCSLKT